MNVEYTGRNLVITQDLRSFTEEKLQRIERILGNLREVHVILATEKHRQICDVVARGRRGAYSATEETDDLFTAIARAVDKLARQAERQKGSRVARRRGGSRTAPGLEELQLPPVREEIPAPSLPRVIRSERYSLKPMTVEEAALQIQSAADDFLVFRNAESERVSVVHRRPDGNLGLIEPEA